MEFFKGGRLNGIYQKGSNCTDLIPNTLYRKCIKFAPKKGGSPPPVPTCLRRSPISISSEFGVTNSIRGVWLSFYPIADMKQEKRVNASKAHVLVLYPCIEESFVGRFLRHCLHPRPIHGYRSLPPSPLLPPPPILNTPAFQYRAVNANMIIFMTGGNDAIWNYVKIIKIMKCAPQTCMLHPPPPCLIT